MVEEDGKYGVEAGGEELQGGEAAEDDAGEDDADGPFHGWG